MESHEYIGSSDARAILSGDWLPLYKIKTGSAEPPDLSRNFAVQLGIITETLHLDFTIDALNEETGSAFRYSRGTPTGQHFSVFRPAETVSSPVLGSHPDALIKTGDTIYPVEAKITGRWKDVEEVAHFYMPQLQHHMLCWGVDQMLLSVVIGTDAPVRAWIGASREWQEHYIKRCDEFWAHVTSQTPPPPLMVDNTKPIVPTSIADSVPINGMRRQDMSKNNSFMAIASDLVATREAAMRHEAAKKELKAMVPQDVKEAYSPLVTLKRDKRGAIRIQFHKED